MPPLTIPAPARLVRSIPTPGFGGDIVKLADIDNDGELEILTLQSAGQLASEIDSRGRDDIDELDRDLHCLTALKLNGEILWRRGTPYSRPELPFTCHGGGNMLLAEDVDADGRCEILTIDGTRLLVLDGKTGVEKAAAELPADNFISLFTAQFGPPEQGRQIICKVNNVAYAPWQYSNPTLVFNADLSICKEPFAVRGAGHNVVALDVDGDGRDELLIGYSLLDNDLGQIWRLDLGEGFDYVHDHADAIAVDDIDGDGRLEVCYSGSEDFFVTDLGGNMLWRTHAGHSQNSVDGPWGPNGEKRIIMSEKNQGLWGMSADGDIFWNRTDINGYARPPALWNRNSGQRSWALFQPQLKPFDNPPVTSDPAWSRGLWPSFIDGDGNLHDIFPWCDDCAHPPRTIRAQRSYDCGLVYQVLAADIDSDGRDEVLIRHRDSIWIFGNAEGE